MRVGLFCKTFKADLGWLYLALSSFQQNWRHRPELTDFVVVADSDCEPTISGWGFKGVRVVYVQPWGDGYCHAMAMKLCADIFCASTELIFLFDSDMMLVRPTGLSDLLEGGRPVVVYDHWDSPYESQVRQMARRVWVPAVRRSLGRELEVDWMVGSEWLYWASTFQGARRLIEAHRGMPFLQAVYSARTYDWKEFPQHPMTLCDMQALGIFASEHESDKYTIRQWGGPGIAGSVKQFWSHQPIAEAKPFII